MSDSEQSRPDKNDLIQPCLPSMWRYEQPPSPSNLYDTRTQNEVLANLLMQPSLLRDSFGDLTLSDFGGSVDQSIFRTMLKLSEDGTEWDIYTLAQTWKGDTQVGDAAAYLAGMLDGTVQSPVRNLRARVDKLHKLSHLRRLRYLGEVIQRQAESAQADPDALLEKIEIGVGGLRSGHDINGELLPYSPKNLRRRPDLIPLSSFSAKDVPWLWEPYLSYGMLHLLSGEPGCGKTFIALAFAAALTVGKIPFVGDSCRPHDVVYMSIENSPEYVVRPRFDALGGDASRLHVLQGAVTGEGPKARREGVRLSDVALLEAAIEQCKARFLVVDPIQSYLGGEVDMHRSNETRPVLDGLIALAKKHDCCILILRHFAKSTSGSAINRGLGSIDLTGAARTELHAGQRDDQWAMAHAKTNIGEFGPSIGYEISQGTFRWTGESSLTANDLAGAGGLSEEDRDGLNEAAQMLEDMLKTGPRLSSEIFYEAKEQGYSQQMMRRAKIKLGVKTKKKCGQRFGQFEWYLDGVKGEDPAERPF